MFIVIDGVDGSGKSTLAAKLLDVAEERTGERPEALHRGPIEQHPLQEYALSLGATDKRVNAIADRWHLGEMIYGPKYRGVSRVTAEMLEWFEMFLESRGALRLLMLTPIETIKQRVTERGDDMVAVDDLDELAEQYEWLARMMPQYLRVGEDDANDTDAIERVVDTAAKLEKRHTHLRAVPSYVGPRLIDVLVVFDGTPQLAGFPGSLQDDGFWVIRSIYNTRVGFAGTRFGFVNSAEAGEAQGLTGATKVLYARNFPRPMAAANNYLKEALT